MKKKKHKPGLLWITGLSGCGKTTVSEIIYHNLKKNYSNVIFLDGDLLRKKLKIKKQNSFSNKSRERVGLKYVNLCSRLVNDKGKFVIIAVMALIQKVQIEYKKIQNNYDVFLDVPIKELKRRDAKGLYKKFKNKEIKNMSGLDIGYDKPYKPSLYLKWKRNMTPLKISKKILKLIEKIGKN